MRNGMPVLLAALLAVQPAWAGGSDDLAAFARSCRSAYGSFEQSAAVSDGGRADAPSSGAFSFQRPGKFRWEVKSPYPQTIVSNGSTLWLWDPDLNQVTVKKLDGAAGAAPASLLFGGTAVRDRFELEDFDGGEGLSWVRARPKEGDPSFTEAEIAFDSKGIPARMRLKDHFGQVTLFTFSGVAVNMAVETSAFEFEIPQGADVFEDRTQAY